MSILISVLLVAAIGIIAGIGLSAASIVMAVPKDETAEKLVETLPGANCGACGFSGCEGYANAMAKGEAKTGLCTVGGDAVAQKCAAILGVQAGAADRKAAVVRCLGTCDNVNAKMNYVGLSSCAAAAQLYGGVSACNFGCIGLGDCAKVCEYGAIDICNEVAIVNRDKCFGCGKCAKVCPKQLIEIVPVKKAAQVMCSNKQKGAVSRKNCKVSCIGCMKCQKVCPVQAIKVENFLAHVDRTSCIGCLKCVSQCPTGALHEMF